MKVKILVATVLILVTHLTRFAKFYLLWKKRNYNILWFLEKTDYDFSPNLLNDKI